MKAPGDLTYSLAMSDIVGTGAGIDHTFAYAVPSSGGPPAYIQGTYRFYTIATDVADNAELAPANPDATTTQTLQDSIAPSLTVCAHRRRLERLEQDIAGHGDDHLQRRRLRPRRQLAELHARARPRSP